MRVYVPDFGLFHGIKVPDIFFRKVEEQGVFVWREEQIAINLEKDYQDETYLFEEAMMKLIGQGLDCVQCGQNGHLFHVSTNTYEVISKLFV